VSATETRKGVAKKNVEYAKSGRSTRQGRFPSGVKYIQKAGKNIPRVSMGRKERLSVAILGHRTQLHCERVPWQVKE